MNRRKLLTFGALAAVAPKAAMAAPSRLVWHAPNVTIVREGSAYTITLRGSRRTFTVAGNITGHG